MTNTFTTYTKDKIDSKIAEINRAISELNTLLRTANNNISKCVTIDTNQNVTGDKLFSSLRVKVPSSYEHTPRLLDVYNSIAYCIPAFSALDKDITTISDFIWVMNHSHVIGANAVHQTTYKENANTFEINNVNTYCVLGSRCFERSNVTKAKFAHGIWCGSAVFRVCKNLTTFDCEQCFEVIWANVFAYCNNLKSVLIRKGFTGLSDVNAFISTPIADSETKGFIYVADDLVNTYKTATNWVTYADKIKPLSEYTEG